MQANGALFGNRQARNEALGFVYLLPNLAAQAFDRGGELFPDNGFGEVAIHASFEAAFFHAGHGPCGDCDDDRLMCRRLVALGFLSPYAGGQFEAIHVGHIYIHEQHIILLLFHELYTLHGVIGDVTGIALPF